ncbi:MAG: adenylyltransferase/cytidyltransferase family protein, partial [Opitutales bacterium]
MIIAITSGYFDPLHRGHLELISLSRKQGDALWVIVNTDAQAALKKGRAAIFADTGLGKTAMQLEWARHVAARMSRVLVLTPL